MDNGVWSAGEMEMGELEMAEKGSKMETAVIEYGM